MKTHYNKLLLAFLFLILAIFAAGGCGPPENGPYVEHYDSGKKKLEGHFKDGKYEGLGTGWYENGQKESETHWKNGKSEGLWTMWYENGQKEAVTHYKDGLKDGRWTVWHENGQKKFEVHYVNGKAVDE